MILKLTPFHFEELIQRGFSLDLIFLLRLMHEQVDITKLRANNLKIDMLYETLLRKELITEEGKITLMGQELLAFMDSKITRRLKKNTVDDSDFQKWWNIYPKTDTFTHGGKSFIGDRGMRVKEEDCRVKFEKIINDGEYKLEELIAALELEIFQKKEASCKANVNKLKFMQNSLTYLNQKTYVNFIDDLVRKGIKVEGTTETSLGYTEV